MSCVRERQAPRTWRRRRDCTIELRTVTSCLKRICTLLAAAAHLLLLSFEPRNASLPFDGCEACG